MAVGEIITAARYNAIQAKVSAVLGTGSGQFGYGVALTSGLVALGNTVNATHMANLKTDLTKIKVHQTGSLPSLTTVASADGITDAVYAEYSVLTDTLYTNKNDIYEATQADTEVKLTSARSTQWGGAADPQSIYHNFSVTFTSENHRRNFFNAGGEVRFSATLTGTSGSKASDWAGMLSAIGTLKFNYTTVTAGSGSAAGIGNFDLTTSYQTVFVKSGSGLYSNNDVTIKARTNPSNSAKIDFSIEFNDDANVSVDESVNGTLTSTISQLRPTGLYVEVATPIYTTTTSLA